MLIPEGFEAGFSALRKDGVLQKVRPESLPNWILRQQSRTEGINLSVCSCCDGHQFPDITGHTFAQCGAIQNIVHMSQTLPNDCFHWHTENGGPFVFSVPSIQTRTRKRQVTHVDENLLASIEEGMRVKKTQAILLISHAVCAKVATVFNSPNDYALHLARAKERVMCEFDLPKERVIAWLQVRRKKGPRLYHLNYSKFSNQ